MANVVVSRPSVVIDGTNNYIVGDAGASAETSSVVAQLVDTGTFSGSIVVKGRPKGSAAAFVAIPYRKRNLSGTASDDSIVSDALTAAFLIEVNASGLDISFDNTHTSGSGTLYIQKISRAR